MSSSVTVARRAAHTRGCVAAATRTFTVASVGIGTASSAPATRASALAELAAQAELAGEQAELSCAAALHELG